MGQSLSQDIAPEFLAFRSIFYDVAMATVLYMWESWGASTSVDHWQDVRKSLLLDFKRPA